MCYSHFIVEQDTTGFIVAIFYLTCICAKAPPGQENKKIKQ